MQRALSKEHTVCSFNSNDTNSVCLPQATEQGLPGFSPPAISCRAVW